MTKLTQTRTLGSGSPPSTVSAVGLGCMGMSEFYGTTDEAESTADHPARPRPRRDLPRHRRHVRPVHQRAAGRQGHRRPARRGAAGHQVRQRARPRTAAGSASTAARTTSARPATRRCSGSASTTSTSTTSTASTARRRSRRPGARWPSWCRPARCGTSASPRRPPATIRAAHAVHPITALQTEWSLWTRDVEENDVLATVRELGIGFVAYSPIGRGFLSGEIRSLDDLAPDDFRRQQPAVPGRELRQEPRAGRQGPRDRRREGRDRHPAGAGLGARPGRGRRADPRHQAGALPRGERRGRRGRARPRRTWPGSTRWPRWARRPATATRTCPRVDALIRRAPRPLVVARAPSRSPPAPRSRPAPSTRSRPSRPADEGRGREHVGPEQRRPDHGDRQYASAARPSRGSTRCRPRWAVPDVATPPDTSGTHGEHPGRVGRVLDADPPRQRVGARAGPRCRRRR